MINESENTVRTEPFSSQSDPPKEKRARATRATSRKGKEKGKVIDLTAEDDAQVKSPPSKKKKKGASPREVKDEEKRLRRFRQYAPSSYLEKLNRATTQRYKRRPLGHKFKSDGNIGCSSSIELEAAPTRSQRRL